MVGGAPHDFVRRDPIAVPLALLLSWRRDQASRLAVVATNARVGKAVPVAEVVNVESAVAAKALAAASATQVERK